MMLVLVVNLVNFVVVFCVLEFLSIDSELMVLYVMDFLLVSGVSILMFFLF